MDRLLVLNFDLLFLVCDIFPQTFTLDARGLLARQRRVVLVGERPLAQAVKSFERADPITFPVISPESRFDPGNLIGRLEKRFLKEGFCRFRSILHQNHYFEALIINKPLL